MEIQSRGVTLFIKGLDLRPNQFTTNKWNQSLHLLIVHRVIEVTAGELKVFVSLSMIVWVASSRNMTAIAQPVPVLTVDNINPNIKAMEYAVRGPLVIRATEIQKELASVSQTL